MVKLFNYRGWQAEVRPSPEDDGYYAGCIEGTCHMLLFGGDTLEEAKQCFMDAVDEYIERGILNQEDV